MKKCLALTILVILLSSCSFTEEDTKQREDSDGSIHVSSFLLPVSKLTTKASVDAMKEQKSKMAEHSKEIAKCPSLQTVELSKVDYARECLANAYYQSKMYEDLRSTYNVQVIPQVIGGVYTEVFTPRKRHALTDDRRVLINLHGGLFIAGSRTVSHMESIPIAALGNFKVISIDYRMAPLHRFPAASEDVASVYKELLKTYEPGEIGIYGCSAGGMITAQSMAWFQKENLPLPGAVGMFCAAASKLDGDAMHIVGAIESMDMFEEPVRSYFENIDMNDPLVTPAVSDAIMSNFPPSLLISSTRDLALSSVIHTHRQLVRLGVEADLHIWEGMSHAFLMLHYPPESQEAYGVIVDFFNKKLGGS